LFVIVKKWFWCTNILLIGQPKKIVPNFFHIFKVYLY
jgi:hypothetical protein